MSDSAKPLEWASKAEEDWIAAHSLLRRKFPLTAIACFHAQQCAEKYIKAMLIARKYPFSKVHDLLILNQECHRAGILLGILEDDLSTLSLYAVKARYPGNAPALEDAREALQTTRTVRRFARKFLNLK